MMCTNRRGGLTNEARLTLVIVGCVLFAGCRTDVEREYVWVRKEPPAAFASTHPNEPTEYTVRLRVDVGKTVTVFETVRFRGDVIDDDIRVWKHCTFFDAQNWECSPESLGDLGVVEKNRIEMRNGALRQEYWGEFRRYESRPRQVR